MVLPRRRKIEVLKLAQRIEAELASGRVDDVELSDEQMRRVASLLRPPVPTPSAEPATADPAVAGRIHRWASRGAAAMFHFSALITLAAGTPPPL
ncbi:hypothetical protein [Micromonospora endophytica]|uniref:Uncharacterized protein n=1 Tax=Micromonospora endophytica TaxID=515350 RepID=A0A2W2DH47_9ACTN|nr:hypothetical protein [Micromonospora endophytica]PZF92113.1 hypothetical protein C1I93_20090 [Micromonospora endophytica]RIW42856.1 hypothetical protein D3H59_21765 [Micromonospora endophytica]BCJ61633.1 hypothetical protein Jiend_50550 [Micromonospora endophytica]